MTKPIIGIIGRRIKVVNDFEREGNIVFYEYMKSLDKAGASYFSLITNDEYDLIDESILKMCDGILMTGGVEIKTYHIKIIEYALENNIPFLGICQGAQAIALSSLTGAKLIDTNELNLNINHAPTLNTKEDAETVVHKVTLEEGSLLYNLFGSVIDVNSNHRYTIPKVEKPIKVVGISEDGLIEAIEHVDKDKFIVGVQWHPENMDSMQPLFEEFVNRSRERMYENGFSTTHLCDVETRRS